MAPRGLSAAEKRVKMLEIFHEQKEFFTLKELERIAPSTCGIADLPSFSRDMTPDQLELITQRTRESQTVKETLDDLVGDGIVTFDKIGTSNYFWAFPSTAGALKQGAVAKAQSELADVERRISEARASIVAESKGREETADRASLLAALTKARADGVRYRAELEAYGAADPVKYARKRETIQVCKDSAVRWTDNTLIAISFCQNQGVEREHIGGMLGIADLDEWEDLKL